MHASPTLYARGPYRVVAQVPDAPDRRFLVIDTAGVPLHEDLRLADACEWVDARVAMLDAGASSRSRASSRWAPR